MCRPPIISRCMGPAPHPTSWATKCGSGSGLGDARLLLPERAPSLLPLGLLPGLMLCWPQCRYWALACAIGGGAPGAVQE